jgi:hypothetical protein
MPMPTKVKIIDLPLGFPTCRGFKLEKLKRKESLDTVQTEEWSVEESRPNSVGSFHDDISEIDNGTMDALDQLSSLKNVFEGRVDALAAKVAQLEEEARNEERKLRKMERQARIEKAHQDYLECLEALASSVVKDKASELMDEKLLKKNGLQWKEVELDL